MKKYICILIILIGIVYSETNEKENSLFEFIVPEGWRSEHVIFPLSFAPDMNISGFEELRFAPGMFNPKAQDYFTYAFFFWINEKTQIKTEEIDELLLKYYKGLCQAVAEKRNLSLDVSKIKISTEEKKIKGKENIRRFTSIVYWYDPFVTGKKLTLHMEIDFFLTPNKKDAILFACVTPEKPSDKNKLWKIMHKIRDNFKCKDNKHEKK